MDGLGAVNFVEDGREGGGFSAAGRAGDKDEAGFFLGDFADNIGEIEELNGGDFGLRFAHHDGDVPSVSEDVYAVTGLFIDHVRAVTGAGIGQVTEESSFTVDKIESDSFGLKWGEALYMGGHICFTKDAKGFHLRWATNAEVDIGNADGDALHRHE